MHQINPKPINHAYIGMGSNLGDRAGNLLLALHSMMKAGMRVNRLSSIYETDPVDVPDAQSPYLNMVVELDGGSLPPPEQLLARLLEIENTLGRRRERPLAARTIDLDLLLFGHEQRETEILTLPHPRLHLRRFVLAPLAELIPDEVHPALKLRYRQLLAASSDDSTVKIWKPGA